ncbi:hypothetical protein NCS57_01294300 [Fusarium keratoplasticum]|uniref:Uncharacterized protein n=1 Tax=Fusarium keratoplasticum TaxID=1328300 RepID=A0ACC0QHN0_9HYPO|nr:hypothetical protein NCS57_01294300 [Fusarium keratoplasticum]KAI8652308.1 hypothetical protein NCS57_01294300 [Fusarium keratoplasticum]KAI8653049.1 hypothetical protein NCS55_01288400 [Fusarium keratoplasticum]
MDILPILNEVFAINPNGEDNKAFFNHGINWLWAVTAIHIVTFLTILSICFVVPESKRVFHYLFTVAVLVGAVSYYGQAATTTLFFARYANWLVAFPSLALGLGLASGVSWTTIACNMAITWLWILPYFTAALTLTSYKWGFFAFGTVSYLILAMSTLNESYKEAKRRGIGRDYLILAGWVNFLWFLYPIAFGISDGGHKVSRTVGSIIFGVLDVLLLPIFAFVFTGFANKWDWRKLELDFSAYRGSRQPDMEAARV